MHAKTVISSQLLIVRLIWKGSSRLYLTVRHYVIRPIHITVIALIFLKYPESFFYDPFSSKLNLSYQSSSVISVLFKLNLNIHICLVHSTKVLSEFIKLR